MKTAYLIILISIFSLCRANAQTEPALPAGCLNAGNSSQNNISISGTTTFTFADLAAFDGNQASNAITVTVKSSAKYRLYIAGVMTGLTASTTNTPIPINTFNISATNPGTSPAITLSNAYQEVAQWGSTTNGRAHILTITRNQLNAFTQAPGSHTLTLHIRFCQY